MMQFEELVAQILRSTIVGGGVVRKNSDMNSTRLSSHLGQATDQSTHYVG